jgi:23S rRNA (uracil1939-C5)-methyltransferase
VNRAARGPRERIDLDIESIDLEAQGVSRHDGKVVFVRDALPGERVRAELVRSKPRFAIADTVEVLRASALRVQPRCPNFGVCGGCSMQHLDPVAQVAIKQRALEDQLRHIGGVTPGQLLRPVSGPTWGYRFRGRLSVRYVPRKGGVLVGFHERGSSYVADMRECPVLPPRMSSLLPDLRDLVGRLSLRERLPQIEFACGVDASGELIIALVLRVLDPPTDQDRSALFDWARTQRVELWLQPKGPDSIVLLCDRTGQASGLSELAYQLGEFGVSMPYRPTDFTQVNHAINEVLVRRGVRLLEAGPEDRVADLFCGLGNFSMPLGRRAREVVGIEGSRTLVERAQRNADANGLSDRCHFQVANLFEMDAERWASLGRFDRVLIDPPREGAVEVCKAIAESPDRRPERIVYVSCNPATLARDAAVLVHTADYRLSAAGVVNMFPHTSHVESVAVFERVRTDDPL